MARSYTNMAAILLLVFMNFCGVQCQTNATLSNASWPYQLFKTETFAPPELLITKNGSQADGYLFFDPGGSIPVETAPLIMTDDNDLIWQGVNLSVFNFGVQTYRGEPHLVYWNGTRFPEPVGRGNGKISILNQAYEIVANVSLGGTLLTLTNATYPSNIDLHEIYITKNDTVVVTANNVTQADLTSVGGLENGWTVDNLVYEIDIATNQVLFRWSSLEHLAEIPFNLSVYPIGTEGYSGVNQSTAWNYFHINAASTFDDGYLISSRYLCSGIAIDRQGNVKWRLQGRDGGDFTLGPNTNFCYQHDIRYAGGSPSGNLTLQMHDNANCPTDNGTSPTTGLILNLDMKSHAVTLDRSVYNPKDLIYATAQGNFQQLPNGHIFLGHGYTPVFEEFDKTGSTVMTVRFGPAPAEVISYRAFKQTWVGCPNTKPAVATAPEDGGTAVYMSWNGATEYDTWYVYSGTSASGLALVDTVKREGFETRVVLPKTMKYVQVEAKTSGIVNGTVVGGCRIVDMLSDVYSA